MCSSLWESTTKNAASTPSTARAGTPIRSLVRMALSVGPPPAPRRRSGEVGDYLLSGKQQPPLAGRAQASRRSILLVIPRPDGGEMSLTSTRGEDATHPDRHAALVGNR